MINRLRNRLAGHPNGALIGIALVLIVVLTVSVMALLVIAAGQWFFVLSPLWLRFGVTSLVVTAGIYWPLRRWLHADDSDYDYAHTEEVEP